MSNRRSNCLNHNSELDETFRFDSKASYKPSKNKSLRGDNFLQNLDFSQRTSEVVRCVQIRNQNILELLEESDEEKRTQKGEKQHKKELWDFFARFEKQSNPDITISDIQMPQNKEPKKLQPNYQSAPYKSQPVQKIKRPKRSQEQVVAENNKQEPNESYINQNSRYPRRHRVHSLRYWLGQKCIYKNGKIVDILKPHQKKQD